MLFDIGKPFDLFHDLLASHKSPLHDGCNASNENRLDDIIKCNSIPK